jgi:hypothetical protein
MKSTARTAALLALISKHRHCTTCLLPSACLTLRLQSGATLAQEDYYSIWTYTSNECAGEDAEDLIRTENYRLWTCFDDGSGVTSMYSCTERKRIQ